MRNPTLLTVILNYRTPEMTLKATDAALRAMEKINGEVIIVDNASGDGSFSRIQKTVQKNGWDVSNRVRTILSPTNGGFGAGNNLAIREGMSDGTSPDYVYILNPDAFPKRDAVQNLMSHLVANPQVGIAGSYIFGADNQPHITAFRFPTIASEFESSARLGPISRLLSNYQVALAMPQKTQNVDWLAGASLMVRWKVFQQIGLFDEKFFLYFEETDLCRRAKNAGWARAYVVDSKVMHIGSVSTGMKGWTRIPQYWLDSRHYYFLKTFGIAYTIGATLANIAGFLICRTREIIQLKKRSTPEYFLLDLVWHGLLSIAKSTQQWFAVSTISATKSDPNHSASDRRKT